MARHVHSHSLTTTPLLNNSVERRLARGRGQGSLARCGCHLLSMCSAPCSIVGSISGLPWTRPADGDWGVVSTCIRRRQMLVHRLQQVQSQEALRLHTTSATGSEQRWLERAPSLGWRKRCLQVLGTGAGALAVLSYSAVPCRACAVVAQRWGRPRLEKNNHGDCCSWLYVHGKPASGWATMP